MTRLDRDQDQDDFGHPEKLAIVSRVSSRRKLSSVYIVYLFYCCLSSSVAFIASNVLQHCVKALFK